MICSQERVCERRWAAVLAQLEFMEGMGRDASEEGVSVVEAGGDEGMDEGFGSRGKETVSDFGDAAEVKVGLDEGPNMEDKEGGGVQDKAEISHWGEFVMVEELMVSVMGLVLLRVDLVPMTRSSVLSLLSLRKWWVSHVCLAEMQVSMWVMGEQWVGLVMMHTWMSLA